MCFSTDYFTSPHSWSKHAFFCFAPLLAALCALIFISACDSSPETSDSRKVVSYSGPTLTAEDAVVTDDFGQERTWRAERDGKLIVLKRSELCGDECSETTKLTLRHRGEDKLPGLVSVERIRMQFLPERKEEHRLEVEQIEVQDWRVNGVVSGRVQGEAHFVFWHDFSSKSGGT